MGGWVGRALTGEVSAGGGLAAAVLDVHHAVSLVMRAPDGRVAGELVARPPPAAVLFAPLVVEVGHPIQLGGGGGGSIDPSVRWLQCITTAHTYNSDEGDMNRSTTAYDIYCTTRFSIKKKT